VVLPAEVAADQGEPASVAGGMVCRHDAGDADLLQQAAKGVSLRLGVPAQLSAVVEQLVGWHAGEVLDPVADAQVG
jgi:hypothetical protein